MQQPALRLALLTFATMLVSGCAEQFAVHMAESAWTVVPVKVADGPAHARTQSRGAGERYTGFRGSRPTTIRLSWCQAGVPAGLSDRAPCPSSPAGVQTGAFELQEPTPWSTGARLLTSDYRRIRVG